MRHIAEVPGHWQVIEVKGNPCLIFEDGTSFDAPGTPDSLWIRLASTHQDLDKELKASYNDGYRAATSDAEDAIARLEPRL